MSLIHSPVYKQALGLTLETVHEEIADQVTRIREAARQAQAKIDGFANIREPAEDPT